MRSHSETKQLALFEWQPPPKVLAFPQSRRIGKARTVAANLMKTQDQPARTNGYVERVKRDLFRMLLETGLSEDVAKRETFAFLDLVHAEVGRMLVRQQLGLKN